MPMTRMLQSLKEDGEAKLDVIGFVINLGVIRHSNPYVFLDYLGSIMSEQYLYRRRHFEHIVISRI
jgi:hypothetical protein